MKGYETRFCYKCGKTGQLAKNCKSEVSYIDEGEKQKPAVVWMVEEESPDVNIAEKQAGPKSEEAMSAEKSGFGWNG